jgi:hypothetical protein
MLAFGPPRSLAFGVLLIGPPLALLIVNAIGTALDDATIKGGLNWTNLHFMIILLPPHFVHFLAQFSPLLMLVLFPLCNGFWDVLFACIFWGLPRFNYPSLRCERGSLNKYFSSMLYFA